MASQADVEISVVIPCLNEERAIAQVVAWGWEGIAGTRRPGEVIVVDNGSTDNSAQLAREAGARVVYESRPGYGSAYLRGLAEARGRYVFMADGDGTYDLRNMKPFLEQLDAGKEFVLGSRFKGRIHEGAMPWKHRWIGNPVLTWILNVFFGVKVSDAHCGLRAIRRSTVARLDLHATGMEFASEMILKAAKRDISVGEVPIDYYARTGESKLNTWRDGWRHLRFMLVHSATFLFIIPGLVLFVLGMIVMLAMAGGPIELFGVHWYIHAMIIGSTATLVGAQIVQLGVFARTYAVLYLDEPDDFMERAWSKLRLEHGLLAGGAVLVAGLALLGTIFGKWAAGGFGALHQEHPALLGLTLIGLGVQILFGSFFLSVLGLRKHLRFGDGPPPIVVEPEESEVERELLRAQGD
jgi:glycosyltransferase involved in cell wall biosynthesis